MKTLADKTDTQVLWFEYDVNDNIESIRDNADPASARIVSYIHDDNNRLTTVTNVLGHDTVYTYDSLGKLIRKEEPGGVIKRHRGSGLHIIQTKKRDNT